MMTPAEEMRERAEKFLLSEHRRKYDHGKECLACRGIAVPVPTSEDMAAFAQFFHAASGGMDVAAFEKEMTALWWTADMKPSDVMRLLREHGLAGAASPVRQGECGYICRRNKDDGHVHATINPVTERAPFRIESEDDPEPLREGQKDGA